MTLEEAVKSGKELILTVEPPDDSPTIKATMIRPYCLMDGYLYGEMQDGKDWVVHEDFVANVELGEDAE